MIRTFNDEKFDIVIQAGQSNAYGYGVGNVDDAFWPDERIWYMNRDFLVTQASEEIMGNEICSNFSLSFARKYVNDGLLGEGRKLLIIRAGVGSTGFLAGHWNETGDCFTRMMEMCRTALELNGENRLIALLWHQGETDVTDGATEEVHYANLSGLINRVRTEFNVPTLPFIAADFVHHWKNANAEICAPVIEAIRSVCATVGNGAFIETADLKSNNLENGRQTQCGHEFITDTIHFSRQSLYILGERYLDEYKRIIQK
jgi:hypothetical protein